MVPGGRYLDEFPGRDRTTYYRVSRTTAGSTLTVAVNSRVPGIDPALVYLNLGTASGENCVRTSIVTHEGVGLISLNAKVFSAPESRGTRLSDECQSATDFIVGIENTDEVATDYPVEISVVEEAALLPLDQDLPDSISGGDDFTLDIPADGSGGTMSPSNSYDDAPILEPGSYRAVLPAGQTQIVAIRLDYGQTLHAVADFPQPPFFSDEVGMTGFTSYTVFMELSSPEHTVIPDLGRGPDDTFNYSSLNLSDSMSTPQDGVLISGATPEVRYWNRDLVDGGWGQSIAPTGAGIYYVTIMGEDISGEMEQFPLEYTLTLEVDGDVFGVPTLGALDGQEPPEPRSTPSEASSAPAPADTPTADAPSGEPAAVGAGNAVEPIAVVGSGNKGLIIALIVVGAVLVGGGTTWLILALRRNKVVGA
jgi:Ca-activated chloride channel family protein